MSRVLIVSRSLPCHVSGGLEFHVIDQARGLLREGVSVDLLTTEIPAGYRNEIESLGLGVHELRGVPPGRYSFPYFRRIGAKIAELNAEAGYDIIHGHEFAFGFGVPPLKEKRTRVILTVHGTLTSETPLHHDVFPALSLGAKARAVFRSGRRLFFAPWWHRTMDRADAIMVDSRFTQMELSRIRPGVSSKVRLVPLAVEAERSPIPDAIKGERLPGRAPVLITVGRLEWQKGHALALRALALSRDSAWRYVIVGAGRELEPLRQLAARLNLADRVEFAGRLEDAAKSRALAEADLFIWPEWTHPAFGLAGLEAMLMGTPVLATRRGAIPEVLGEPGDEESGGWTFDPPSPEAMAARLIPLLKNPALLAAKKTGLRERTLSRFDSTVMSDRMIQVYEEALARSDSPSA